MFKERTTNKRLIALRYKEPLRAKLSIVEVRGCSTQSKAALISVDKISVNGLRFLSELIFPVHPRIILNFRVVILDETIDLRGTITWSQREENTNIFEVIFIKDDLMSAKLKVMLSNLAIYYMPLHRRAAYYYNYISESTYSCENSRINLLM
jgi:hypothetical protein